MPEINRRDLPWMVIFALMTLGVPVLGVMGMIHPDYAYGNYGPILLFILTPILIFVWVQFFRGKFPPQDDTPQHLTHNPTKRQYITHKMKHQHHTHDDHHGQT